MIKNLGAYGSLGLLTISLSACYFDGQNTTSTNENYESHVISSERAYHHPRPRSEMMPVRTHARERQVNQVVDHTPATPTSAPRRIPVM